MEKKIKKLKAAVEEKTAEYHRLTGRYEHLMQRFKQAGYTSTEEASARLDEIRTALGQENAKLAKMIEDFTAKFEDIL